MNDTPLYFSQRWEFRCTQNSDGQGWRWCCRSHSGTVIASGSALFPSLSAAIEDARRNGFHYASIAS
jgi:hypothetical protein